MSLSLRNKKVISRLEGKIKFSDEMTVSEVLDQLIDLQELSLKPQKRVVRA